MKCPYCNYDIRPGDRYCENCGASAVSEPEPAANDPYQGGGQYYPQNTNAASGYGNNQYGGYNQYGSNSQYGYGNDQYGGNAQYSSYDQYSSYNHGNGSPKFVGFGEAIKLFFVNYVNFKGRSTRSEFWFAYLFQFLVRFGVSFIFSFLGSIFFISSSSVMSGVSSFSFARTLVGIVDLAMFLPALSIGVRRLHDIGRSGWWILLEFSVYLLVPGFTIFALLNPILMNLEIFLILLLICLLASLAGVIVLIIMWCRPSDGANKWGAPADPFRNVPRNNYRQY